MTLNIRNLQSAELEGQTKFLNWYDEFQKEWNGPLGELIFAAFYNDLHPMVKAELAARVPEAVKNLNERFGK